MKRYENMLILLSYLNSYLLAMEYQDQYPAKDGFDRNFLPDSYYHDIRDYPSRCSLLSNF